MSTLGRTLRSSSWPGIAVAVVAAVILVPLALAGGRHPGKPVASIAPAAPKRHELIRFRQVAAISKKPCPPGSHGMPGSSLLLARHGVAWCFHLTPVGMTITGFRSVKVVRESPGQYAIAIELKQAAVQPFYVLTRKVCGQANPRDILAIIVGGQVVSDPEVTSPIVVGLSTISAGSHAQAERLLKVLKGV